MSSEAYAYHATDLAELPRKYGRQLEHRTKAGGLYFASEYIQAQRVRTIIQQAVAQLFQHIDVLLCPTMPTEPPTYEASLADTWMYRPGITNLFNLTGQPAVAFPTGFSAQTLPLSAQLVGRPFDEATGAARRPPLPGRDGLAQAPPSAVGLSLSRLNHWLPRGQAHPEVVQGTAEFHHQIADALLPQADPVFHDATALDTAVDMLDPQPPLVERLVGQLLLQGQLLHRVASSSA